MATVSGGSSYLLLDSLAGTVLQVKAQAAQITGLKIVNGNASAAYIQIFNTTANNVTIGTTIAFNVIRIAASEAIWMSFNSPMALGGSGLSLASTTTATGSTGATLSVGVFYL
jgi:hypothetical protein